MLIHENTAGGGSLLPACVRLKFVCPSGEVSPRSRLRASITFQRHCSGCRARLQEREPMQEKGSAGVCSYAAMLIFTRFACSSFVGVTLWSRMWGFFFDALPSPRTAFVNHMDCGHTGGIIEDHSVRDLPPFKRVTRGSRPQDHLPAPCNAMFYSALEKAIHCRQGATWANHLSGLSLKSPADSAQPQHVPSKGTYTGFMTQDPSFDIYYWEVGCGQRSRQLALGIQMSWLTNKYWNLFSSKVARKSEDLNGYGY